MTEDDERAPKHGTESVGEGEGGPAEAAAEAEAEAREEAEAPRARPEGAAAGPPELEPEPEPLAEARAEVAELKDRYLRAMAEVENVRRRAARDRDDAGKYAISSLARELLSVVDNLDRALASVSAEARAADESLDALVRGIEITQREMAAVLERHAIRPVAALGEKFDHNLHQAVVEIEDASQPAGTVVQVMQTGYTIADRLLRPAMVALAKGGAREGPGGAEEKAGEGEASGGGGGAREEPGGTLDTSV